MLAKSAYPQGPESLRRSERISALRSACAPSRSVQKHRPDARVFAACTAAERVTGGTDWSSEWDSKPRGSASIFRPQFHSPRHVFPQPMLHRSINKPLQINALDLVGKITPPSSFGENPPIRREKARPFRPRTIKVSGEKPANAREFRGHPRAESRFS